MLTSDAEAHLADEVFTVFDLRLPHFLQLVIVLHGYADHARACIDHCDGRILLAIDVKSLVGISKFFEIK